MELKHLVEAGLLAPGDKLVATHRDFVGIEAIIGEDARIHLSGKSFGTPSGAGHHLRGKATDGWYFWGLADGRRLRDVRSAFLSAVPAGDAQPESLGVRLEPVARRGDDEQCRAAGRPPRQPMLDHHLPASDAHPKAARR